MANGILLEFDSTFSSRLQILNVFAFRLVVAKVTPIDTEIIILILISYNAAKLYNRFLQLQEAAAI